MFLTVIIQISLTDNHVQNNMMMELQGLDYESLVNIFPHLFDNNILWT